MALTTAHATNIKTKFKKDFVLEYLRYNQFAKYMGSSENSIIWVQRDLQSERGGVISVPLIRNLAEDDGIIGNNQMEGNEETMLNFGQRIQIEYHRKAVATTKRERQRTEIELLKAARSVLMNWKLAMLRNHIIRQMSSITTQSTGEYGVLYAAATAAHKNEFNTNNADRIMYGNALGNTVAGDHAASIANINVGQRMTGALLSILKRHAQTADDTALSPIRVKQDNNEEWLVCFMPTFAFRDFRSDPSVLSAQQDANVRGRTNPMFRGGDLLWDGMVVREIKEIPNITETGAGAVPLAPVFLCGKTALHTVYAQDANFESEKRDLNFITSVGVDIDYAVRKAVWQTDDGGTAFKDYGIATAYVPNVGDA